MPVAGAEVEDYLPRLIPVGHDEVLAGVRFRGGLPSGCFVELYVATTPLSAGGLLRDVTRAVAAQWKMFRPRSLRIYHPHELPRSEIGRLKSVEVDHIVYAAPIGEVRKATLEPRDARYVLTAPVAIDFYDEYVSAYDSYHDEHPELRGLVLPETENLLEELRKANLLRIVTLDGIWQGVMAARPEVDHGMQGFLIVENCLGPSARQRGLSASLLKEFISGLPAPDDSIVFGTIDPRNVASTRTARRIGRQAVMWATFVGLH